MVNIKTLAEEARKAFAIDCGNTLNTAGECGKFNRYKPYSCDCGSESRRLEALEDLAQKIIDLDEANDVP